MANQFEGMSSEPFTYDDFEKTRAVLINTLQQSLTREDKVFLLSFSDLNPDWNIYDFERFPAVQWKLQNLIKLKADNLEKFNATYIALEKVLG